MNEAYRLLRKSIVHVQHADVDIGEDDDDDFPFPGGLGGADDGSEGGGGGGDHGADDGDGDDEDERRGQADALRDLADDAVLGEALADAGEAMDEPAAKPKKRKTAVTMPYQEFVRTKSILIRHMRMAEARKAPAGQDAPAADGHFVQAALSAAAPAAAPAEAPTAHAADGAGAADVMVRACVQRRDLVAFYLEALQLDDEEELERVRASRAGFPGCRSPLARRPTPCPQCSAASESTS